MKTKDCRRTTKNGCAANPEVRVGQVVLDLEREHALLALLKRVGRGVGTDA
jgi:hypothetical protein